MQTTLQMEFLLCQAHGLLSHPQPAMRLKNYLLCYYCEKQFDWECEMRPDAIRELLALLLLWEPIQHTVAPNVPFN